MSTVMIGINKTNVCIHRDAIDFSFKQLIILTCIAKRTFEDNRFVLASLAG